MKLVNTLLVGIIPITGLIPGTDLNETESDTYSPYGIQAPIGPCDKEGIFITVNEGDNTALYRNCYSKQVSITPRYRVVGKSEWEYGVCSHPNPGQSFHVSPYWGLLKREFSYVWGCV